MTTTDTTLPDKITTTNPKKDTFVDVTHSLQDGYLLYQPDQNAFIALYPDEFLDIRQEGEANNNAIAELQTANQDVTEKSLALAELKRHPNPAVADIKKAEADLDQALATLSEKSEAAKTKIEKIADLKADEKKLVEVLPLTMRRAEGHKAYYVPAAKLKKAAADKRIYLVEGKAERTKAPKEKLLNGVQLNGAEVKRRIAEQVIDKAKFSKKWKLKPKDADEYSGQFFSDWSRTMGAEAKDFLEREQKDVIEGVFGKVNSDPNDPHRKIDLKSEAQLMRWSAGAGLEANFLPFQGNLYDKRDKDWKSRFKRAAKAAQFNVKANAEASFAVGEAKVQTMGYYPHYAGWHLTPAAEGIALDLGHFRLEGDMTLYAVAGASIALEASAALMLTYGKQGLKGVPKNAKAGKAKVGADGKVELFAGLKEGIDLLGAFQWLNPEGFIDEKSPKRKDPTKTWGEYVNVASVMAGVAAIEGLAATLGFEVSYKNGNFVIAAKASACLGLGGSGNFGFKVGADSTAQFFMCIAHQLKQADYHKLRALMAEDVFKAYNQILYMVTALGRDIRDFADYAGHTLEALDEDYKAAVRAVRAKGAKFIEELEQRLSTGWGWFAYMPPESRGAVLASITDVMSMPQYASNSDLRQKAAFTVNELLATAQTDRHLDNTFDRVTVAMGDAPGKDAGLRAIDNVTGSTSFAGASRRTSAQLAGIGPLLQRPFLRNDDAPFVVAKLGLDHAASTV
jgi:hypothetical protein